MKKLSFFCLLIGFSTLCFSQEKNKTIVPVELMLGNQRSFIQLSVRKPVFNKLTYMNQSLAMTDYKNSHNETELIMNNWFIYNFHPNIGISAGLQYHFLKGLVPSNTVHLGFGSSVWKLILTQGVEYMPNLYSMTVGIVEFTPELHDKIRLYSQAQALYNYDLKDSVHGRSLYYFRLGLWVKKVIFGVGANVDFYGPKSIKKENYGGFVKMLF